MTEQDEALVNMIEEDDKRRRGLSWHLILAALGTSLLAAITAVAVVIGAVIALRSKDTRIDELSEQLRSAGLVTACRSNLAVALESADSKASEAERSYLEAIGNLTVHLASLPPGDPNRAAAFQGDFAAISAAVSNLHDRNAVAVAAREDREATSTICKENP